jgi:hypothetical protein
MMPFADAALARRLERTEGDSNARFVEARASINPESGAAWIDVAGTYAMFDGVSSPCTQTFGFGLFSPPNAADLDVIERFFRERSAPVFHEVSPLADPSHVALLNARGYRPVEFSTVLFRSIADEAPRAQSHGAITARTVAADEAERWAQTLAAGWSDVEGVGGLLGDLARIMAARSDAHLFVAELDGRVVAAGALWIGGGVALLAGASTIPAARRRGAQHALLACRLAYAAAHGCDLAMVVAMPGSESQRNAERNGFRIAYTRTKWQLIVSGNG